MHSYTIIYARTTYLCIKQDSRWQISLHGAYRLETEGLGTLQIEKFCAWVGERYCPLTTFIREITT